ncbi:MAG: hypothetical protein J2P15_04425 [Micromonosporaceae bacterium]|nr:hypothetical protein [Micromonosporaceae bacterium]
MAAEVDYPAAHSMDTAWFAIDADGHVGVFDSGEPGAVPAGHADPAEAYQLLRLPVSSRGVFDRAGHVPLVVHPQPRTYHDPTGDRLLEPLLFLTPEAEIPAELRALPGVVTPALPDGWAVSLCLPDDLPESDPVAQFMRDNRELWTQFVQRVHAQGWCLGCHHVDDSGARFAQRGAFCYSSQETFYIAEPYGRTIQPTRPLHVSELPAQLRTVAEARRLPHRFADTVYIQPVEHLDCQTWTPIYLTEDGSTIRGVGLPESAQALAEIQAEAQALGVRTEEAE